MKQQGKYYWAIEHQQDSLKDKWGSSGAREHTLKYHSNFNWLHSKTIAREMSYRQRKIRQAQGIKKAKLDQNIKLLN